MTGLPHKKPSSRAQRAAIFALAVALLAALALTPVVYFAVFDEDQPSGAAQIVLVEKLGGDTTAFTSTRNAFGLPARNLEGGERRTFVVGNSFFRQNWVTAPASTVARDGLGPSFNAQSCSSCHTLDGRGKPPDNLNDPQRGLLFRLSIPGKGPHGGPMPDPVYAGQLQDRAVLPVPPEGRMIARYHELPGKFEDGEPYSLRAPTYEIGGLAYGPLHPEARLSPRVAPAIVGMGLLEAIPDAAILALADPDDANGDGISGRPNMVWDVRRGKLALGRFGWKANQPTVEQQTAGAFLGDMGITSTLFPDENCPEAQPECRAEPNGGSPEIPNDRFAKVVFYTQTLAVPAMRNLDDPQVARGARLFAEAGCQLCHTPSHATGEHPVNAVTGQTIYPYTDLLLHDMGEGLADGATDFDASGREWRTPPLWGIGLVETVNGHTMFLHDGRARNLTEAILWHGGEATKSRESFRGLTSEEREALIKFLESL